MSEVELQIDIDDLYYSTSEVYKIILAARTGASISDIAQGIHIGKRPIAKFQVTNVLNTLFK